MTTTTTADLTQQQREVWSTLFEDELRETHKLVALLDRSQDAEVKRQGMIEGGKTFYVSQLDVKEGETLDIDTNQADEFNPQVQTASRVRVDIDKRFVSSREFTDLTEIQTIVSMRDPKVRDIMVHEMAKEENKYLLSKSAAPSTIDTGIAIASFSADDLTTAAQQADDLFWPEDQRWLFVDASYHKALLDDSTLTSADFGAGADNPVLGGSFVVERYGWKIVKDTSAAFRQYVGNGSAGCALFFIPDYLHYIVQQESRMKESDQHSNRKFGAVMSHDKVGGAALSNDGADKHLIKRVAA